MHFQPKDFDIFQIMEQHLDLVRQACQELKLCTEGKLEAPAAFAEIQKLERDGDDILRNAIRRLDRQIIDYPPREEIRRIFYHQDRILDAAEHLAGGLAAYRIGALPESAVRLAGVVECCARILADALQSFGASQRFTDQVEKLVHLENEADQVCLTAIQQLVDSENDPRRFLMLRDLYGLFDELVDRFEDCIQVMEDSVLKHAP